MLLKEFSFLILSFDLGEEYTVIVSISTFAIVLIKFVVKKTLSVI